MPTRPASGPWPHACQGAVSLTFDDGLSSHLTTVLPLLEESHLRATFYLTPPVDGDADSWRTQLAPWRAAARGGHEIGNHSLTHPCSQNFAWMTRPGLEVMTLADIAQDVLEAERRLQVGIPEQRVRSYGYPCYQTEVGAGATRQSYVPVIARHFVAGRSRGETANDAARCDLHALWSWPVERLSGAELVGLAERAAQDGRWTILTFHGIDEGHLPVAAVDLQEVCRYLDRARERLWTAPVATVAQRIAEWRQGQTSA